MSHPQETTRPESPVASDDVLAFPASVAQQVFWYLEMFQEGVTAFNVPMRFRLDGPLDIRRLEKTIHILIDRHEALRTYFAEDDGELLQVVSPLMEPAVSVIDLSHLPADRMRAEIDRLGSIEARRPFKLSTGPMVRAEVLRCAPQSHILHFTVHHSLFDGLSMTVFTRELASVYQDLSDGRQPVLDPLPIQYGDFSVWQHEYLKGPEIARQLEYWKQKLSGMKELDLPTDRPRPPVKSWDGDIVSRLLPTELTDKLTALAASHGSTIFHLQLAAFKILLHHYCDSTDIALGTPVTGRTRGETEPLIGVFINSLILRSDLSANPPFMDFLGQVRGTVFEALENQELPFEHLVRELRPVRDQGRNPLFQVNFNHHKSFGKPGEFGGVTLSPMPSRSPGTMFDLHVFMVERGEGWRASCDYSKDLFDRETAERILGHFERLLHDIADHPDKRIFDLEIIADSEKHTLTREWSAKRPSVPRPDATLNAEGPIYLLDKLGRLVPTGVPGTLHLGVEGNPSSPATIEHLEFGALRPTPDVMRWNNRGELEFVRSLDAPAPPPTAPEAGTRVSPTSTDSDTGKRLSAIWCELLDLSSVSPDETFFSLGGHSLMALRLFSRIKRDFGVSLPMAALISNPTVRSLAAQIDGCPKTPNTTLSPHMPVPPPSDVPKIGNLITLSAEGTDPPLFCIHGGDGGVFFYRNLASNLKCGSPVHAIESLELGSSEAITPAKIEDTAKRYIQILLSFRSYGPYRLAGYSFGGVVAHEMACQLTELGHDVEFLGLFDTRNPAAPARRYKLPERLGVFWKTHHDQPLGKRLFLVGKRFNEGVRTHRRIQKELKDAMTSGPAEAYTDLRCVQLREENWRAMQAYQPRPFKGRTTLFKSNFVNDKIEETSDYGWSSLALGGLDIRTVTGHHLEIFEPENIDTLAEALANALDPSQRRPA